MLHIFSLRRVEIDRFVWTAYQLSNNVGDNCSFPTNCSDICIYNSKSSPSGIQFNNYLDSELTDQVKRAGLKGLLSAGVFRI